MTVDGRCCTATLSTSSDLPLSPHSSTETSSMSTSSLTNSQHGRPATFPLRSFGSSLWPSLETCRGRGPLNWEPRSWDRSEGCWMWPCTAGDTSRLCSSGRSTTRSAQSLGGVWTRTVDIQMAYCSLTRCAQSSWRLLLLLLLLPLLLLLLPSSSSSCAFPARSLGFVIFWWDVYVCDCFAFKSNHWGSHIPSLWMVRDGCVSAAGIDPPRTRMLGSFESVQWNACVHRQDLSLYLHPKEFGGMESEPMLTPREKFPLPENSPERRMEPRTLHQAGQGAHHSTNKLVWPYWLIGFILQDQKHFSKFTTWFYLIKTTTNCDTRIPRCLCWLLFNL